MERESFCKLCGAKILVKKSNGKTLKEASSAFFDQSDIRKGYLEKFCHKCGSLLKIPYTEGNTEVLLASKKMIK